MRTLRFSKYIFFLSTVYLIQAPVYSYAKEDETGGLTAMLDSIDTIQDTHEENLNEVVVVGYGTQKRTHLTGSVTSLKGEIFTKSPAPTLDAGLAGQVAGLNVVASSGQLGAESTIRIRGGNSVTASNEPLYVIDGFIYFRDASNSGTGLGAIESSLNPLSIVNPKDIESIEVLKDVSATAIYGSRGANGVILITTKKGSGKKARINYGFNISHSSISRKLNLLNASEWASFEKKYFGNKGGYSDDDIDNLGTGTDWQSAVLRNAWQLTHELSVNGGTDGFKYSFSANYTNQQGIVLNSGFQRYNFHTNLEWKLLKGLTFALNATYGRSKQDGLTTTEEQVFNSSPFSDGITNSFVYSLLMPPVVPVYNSDGSYNFGNPYEYAYFAIGDHAANPVYDLNESVAENINNYLLSNIWASYRFYDFTLRAAIGLSSEKLTQNYFSGAYTSLGLATEGIGGTGNRQTDVWQQEYTLTWNHYLNDDNYLDALAGFTSQSQTSTYSSIRVNHFTNESLKQYNLGDGANIYPPKTGISKSSLNSLIARVNYTFKNRYNATATFRADHSSRFSKNNRWGYFPSLGLSWNVNQESFLDDIDWITSLKLRLSGGWVGNQEIPDYAFTTSYATGSYAGSSSYTKDNTANDNLKWETTASYNVGLDFQIFNNRIGIIADAYYKKTNDLLLVVPMGFSAGVSTQLQNVGNVVNKGVEFTLNSRIINTMLKNHSLIWTASANIAFNHNEITDMGKANDIIQGADNQQILRVGESLGSFYGLRFLGVVQQDDDISLLPKINGRNPQPGDLKFEDRNKDGKIDGSDRLILGSSQPKIIYGFSTQLAYRGFDFSLNFAGSTGNKVYNALFRRLELTGDSYNMSKTVLNSWTPENKSNSLGLASNPRPFGYIDSRYVEPAGFLKLRNVTLGYTFYPLGNKARDFSLRLHLTGSNLFTLTRYRGYDPEVGDGTDSGAYPSARSFTFGITLSI